MITCVVRLKAPMVRKSWAELKGRNDIGMSWNFNWSGGVETSKALKDSWWYIRGFETAHPYPTTTALAYAKALRYTDGHVRGRTFS